VSTGKVPSPLAGLKREIELWVGVIFLFCGIALLVTGLNLAATEWSFERGATCVRATVIDRDFVPADRDENPKTVYLVRYRYSTLEGEARERVEEVSVERWEALPPGAELEVALLSGFEPRTEEKTRANWSGVLALLAMGTPFTVFGVWFGVPRMRRALRLISALPLRGPGRGRCSDRGLGIRINRVPMVRMRFRFRDAKGVSHEGETGPLYPEEAAALQPGACGAVRYDASAPDVSVWVGREEDPR
jgi:hypothetical protein